MNGILLLFTMLKLIVISYFKEVYVYDIFCDRIGHQIPLTIYFSLRKNESKHEIFTTHSVANAYWHERISKHLKFKHYRYFQAALKLNSKNFSIKAITTSHLDPKIVGGYYNEFKQFSINKSELKTLKVWLDLQGVNYNLPIAIFNIRDDEYLKNKFENENVDVSYHSYRNSRIETYEPAINYLLNNGYIVIRAGIKAEKRCSIVHQNFIDYPFTVNQSSKIEIISILAADFYVSSISGPDALAWVSNCRQLYLNVLPFSNLFTFANATIIPKKLKWINNGKKFSLQDYFEDERYKTSDYLNDGIEITDLTDKEILKYLIEFLDHNDFVNLNSASSAEKLIKERFEFVHENFRFSNYWLNGLPLKR